MKLYLLRHGLAGDPDPRKFPDDDQRPLTREGERKTRRLAAALARGEISFDAIVSSPLVRAMATAGIVAGGLRAKRRLRVTPHLAPAADSRRLIRELRGLKPAPASLLLVGHEPDLGALVSLLCTGGPDLPIKFKKGALCRLEVEELKHGRCAVLEWLIPPAALG